MRSLGHFGVRGKTEVVVRTEVEHLLAIDDDLRALLAGDDAFALEEAGFLDTVQLVLQVALMLPYMGSLCWPRR